MDCDHVSALTLETKRAQCSRSVNSDCTAGCRLCTELLAYCSYDTAAPSKVVFNIASSFDFPLLDSPEVLRRSLHSFRYFLSPFRAFPLSRF